MTNIEIEEIEHKYLNKFYHFLKYVEDDIMFGLQTKEDIRKDWEDLWGTGISSFDVGAERIIYALFNGKGIGQPNSAPVGSDLFFEVEDAYIHIDLKTVKAETNLGDFSSSALIGNNQNSYKSEMMNIQKRDNPPYELRRMNIPALPKYYNYGNDNEKICLTFFINILYEEIGLSTLSIFISCVPNGQLVEHYGAKVLQAGKNPNPIIHTDEKGDYQIGKARYNFKEVSKFELLQNTPSRIKVVFFNMLMNDIYIKRLDFIKNIYEGQ